MQISLFGYININLRIFERWINLQPRSRISDSWTTGLNLDSILQQIANILLSQFREKIDKTVVNPKVKYTAKLIVY